MAIGKNSAHTPGDKPVIFSGLLARCVTGVFYVAVFVAALWFGTAWTALLTSFLAMFAARELYAMLRTDGKLPNPVLGVAAAGSFPLAAAVWGAPGLLVVMMMLILGSLGWYVVFLRSRLVDAALTVVGSAYIGLLLSALVMIRSGADTSVAALVALAVVFSVWANDSFAYVFGSLLGKHKLAPKVSPHKSWEGFFAGVVGSVVCWALIPQIPGVTLAYPWAILGGVVCGVAAVVGDLVESRIKREIGVKDSGKALPGHGGFFDRIDSMLFVLPLAFWILYLGGVL